MRFGFATFVMFLTFVAGWSSSACVADDETDVFAEAGFENGPLDIAEVSSTQTTFVSAKQPEVGIPLSPSRNASPKSARAIPNPLANPNAHRMASALSLVLGVLLLLVVINRFFGRRRIKSNELIEVMGRVSVSPKHQLHLVRVYDQMLLLAETPGGLTQIDLHNEQARESVIASVENERPSSASNDDSKQLLDMIRNSEAWKSPLPNASPAASSNVSHNTSMPSTSTSWRGSSYA